MAVRVVAAPEQLVAIFLGVLGNRTEGKHPALFWPFDVPGRTGAETPGVYLHPELFREAAVHVGGDVMEVRQGEVTLNLRRM